MLTARDVQVAQIVLDGIFNILNDAGDPLEGVCKVVEECGGLTLIEDLQTNSNETIYKLACNIQEMFFGGVSCLLLLKMWYSVRKIYFITV